MANDWHTEYSAYLSYISCKDTFYWVFLIILTQKIKVKNLYYTFSLRVKPKWKNNYYGNIRGFPGGSDGKNLPAMQETWGLEDLLEEGMATHSSSLAWRIAWAEEPAVLQSMGKYKGQVLQFSS